MHQMERCDRRSHRIGRVVTHQRQRQKHHQRQKRQGEEIAIQAALLEHDARTWQAETGGQSPLGGPMGASMPKTIHLASNYIDNQQGPATSFKRSADTDLPRRRRCQIGRQIEPPAPRM